MSHSSLRVRAFEPRDTNAVAAVILPIQQIEFGIPITLDAQPDLGDIPRFYQNACGNFWVAEIDERIVGTIALLDIGHQEAALRKMFVAAPFRGSRFGVAEALLHELFDWARRKELARIYLGTTDKFLAAHRFYEKNGFARTDRSSLPGTFPVMAVDSRFYRITLASDH